MSRPDPFPTTGFKPLVNWLKDIFAVRTLVFNEATGQCDWPNSTPCLLGDLQDQVLVVRYLVKGLVVFIFDYKQRLFIKYVIFT